MLKIDRYLSHSDKNSYDRVEWNKTDVDIIDSEGNISFVQKGVEFPTFYSPLSRKIVASRYFYGENGTSERENSLKQIIERVGDTFGEWASKQKYFSKKESEIFSDEIKWITLNQMMSPNSPVWFNVGTDKYESRKSKGRKSGWRINDKDQTIPFHTELGIAEVEVKKGQAIPLPLEENYLYPQTAACFIQGVPDTMEGIMQLAYNEAMLFKHGSGTGTDLSTLRSFREKLSGGGVPSGPLAYEIFYDKVAGIVKSGGKTRRAAKMNSLKDNHPDIMEFIEAKPKEQKKLEVLMDYLANEVGLSSSKAYREASETVSFQNVNFSVRATDALMQAYENNEEWQTIPVHSKELADQMPKYKAKELLKKIAEGTWACGDPGMQFHDTINKWHTCPNSGPINASNPCSEYLFVDDSACNLASQNLMKFVSVNEDNTIHFDTTKFQKIARFTTYAQDLEIDNSSYPTRKIAENAHKFRPLGMGYANLGSLLMYLGLSYDSDEGRAVAASITALLTGSVYEASTEMAEKLGSFEEYEKNKEPMLKVIGMHREALGKIDREKLPQGLENILEEAEKTWDRVIEKGEKYGFRNAQATVLAPTGTIGFMMDCDTKGIEPEIGLVQTKLLSGGGTLKLVNTTVQPTLERLGYDEEEIQEVLEYVKENEIMEGAPHIKEEHLPIFDCSNKPDHGTRTISYMGHLKMMGAVQPFLSGGISKTVNLSKDISAEEIEQAYYDSWKMGLKAVAMYRDGSKRAQPLSFSKKLEKEVIKPIRRKLPITRSAEVHTFNLAGHKGGITTGMYPEDNTPGEIWLQMYKEGSTVGGLLGCLGIATSVALQYGAPLDTLLEKFRYQKFEPSGLVREGHPDIHEADSVVDYVAHYLQLRFPSEKDKEKPTIEEIQKFVDEINSNDQSEEENLEERGGPCAVCGEQTFKKGGCVEVCKCGWVNTSGCGA
ncbi:ribonucleoside-diphosphate reductase, adenosylcobalamin-dependent [archaeon]|nr:ribonucleoside-diphosphate reductase, adenosylcobalamin-dependent [archaeon]